MKRSFLETYARCPNCQAHTFEVRAFEESGDTVVNGVLVCAACSMWYRVDERLPELLLPNLRDTARLIAFQQRFHDRFDGWQTAAPAAALQSDAHKLQQREFFDSDAVNYDREMHRLSFWKAFNRIFLEQIRNRSGGVMLEIGGGTGRMSAPVNDCFEAILSFDLSEAMVRTAQAKGGDRIHHFLGDAENIPVRSGTADLALICGVLHHVENPPQVLLEMARALRPGGDYLGVENNRSAFRPLFDLLMRLKKLWNEEASEEHFIIDRRELTLWCSAAGLTPRLWTGIFLPPHLVSLLPAGLAETVLRASDAFCHRVPWLRGQGGLIYFARPGVAGQTARRGAP